MLIVGLSDDKFLLFMFGSLDKIELRASILRSSTTYTYATVSAMKESEFLLVFEFWSCKIID